jgi:pimeloyl-ACP methyl ester carboxylesterase
MERSAADLRALLDHLGIDRAYVGGLSMGAGVSTRFTLRYLERVAALLIIDSQSASGIPLTPAMRAMREKSIQLLEAGRGLPIADFAVLVHGEADAVEQVRQMYEAMNPVGFANTLRATLVADSITGKLAQIRVPTLIVVGEADEALGPSRATHERIAGSKLVVIPKARHLSNLDQPELFNRTVLEFLADVDRRRAGFG